MGSWGGQSPSQVNTFGAFPNDIARQLNRNLLKPLTNQFGWGQGSGPLAGLVNDVKGQLPGILSQSSQGASQYASMLPQMYSTLQNTFQSTLPQLGQEANRTIGTLSDTLMPAGQQGVQSAQQAVAEAFSPMQTRSNYVEQLRQATQTADQNAAGRGVLNTGDASAMHNDIARGLAYQNAQTNLSNQQAALGGLGQATQNLSGLSQSGLAPLMQLLSGGQTAQSMLGSAGQLANLGINNQLGTYGNILQLLTSGLSPGIQLTGATAPVVGQSGKTGRVI